MKIINFNLQLPDQSDGKNGDDSDSDVSDISGLSETAWKSSPGKEALILQATADISTPLFTYICVPQCRLEIKYCVFAVADQPLQNVHKPKFSYSNLSRFFSEWFADLHTFCFILEHSIRIGR